MMLADSARMQTSEELFKSSKSFTFEVGGPDKIPVLNLRWVYKRTFLFAKEGYTTRISTQHIRPSLLAARIT